jgi:hypothetical protein
MGPQVHLRMPVLKKDKSVRVEFMAFGGGWVDQTLKKTMEATPHTGECELQTCGLALSPTLIVHQQYLPGRRLPPG